MNCDYIVLRLAQRAKELDEKGRYTESDQIDVALRKLAHKIQNNVRTAAKEEPKKDEKSKGALFDRTTIDEKDMGDYILRNEYVQMGLGDNEGFEMESAFTKEGYYIGDPKNAKFYIDKKGLKDLQPAQPENNVVSIGFSPERQKWAGWSHRAYQEFGIGDKTNICVPFMSAKDREKHGQEIKTLEEAKEAAREFADSVS